jgi:hypothetical protein
MIHTPYPYHRPKSKFDELKPVKLADEGSEGKIPKFAWLSDGAVRPIEQGLPLFRDPRSCERNGKSSLDSLISLLVDKPYVKEFNRVYGSLAARHPEYDITDPDMMSHYERQLIAQHSVDPSAAFPAELNFRVPGTQQKTTQVPAGAHLHTWGGAIPYLETELFPEEDLAIPEPKVIKKDMRTGINGPVNAHAPDQSAIIRPIHFATIPESELADPTLANDSATSPLIFAPGGKRFSASVSKLPGGTNDHTVQHCVKRFFDPEVGIPFVPADVGDYFPFDIFAPDSPESEKEPEPLAFDTSPGEECDPRTTLIETKNEDVLFTKNKAPFTRADIATIRAFGRHWDNLKIAQRARAEAALKKRQHIVRQAFHSKEVFKTFLGLMDEDVNRIRSGVLGKSPYKGTTLWQVATDRANNDHTGLAERREFWWRVAAFVRFVGGVSEALEKEFLKELRVKLMLRHPITASLFWDVVRDLPLTALENIAALRLIEFCRVALSVGQEEFGFYLDEQRISHMIYNQMLVSNMSRDFVDRMNQISHGPISVPHAD